MPCDSVHIVPNTGRVRFSRTFVDEPGSDASLRHLSHCLGGTSGFDADACLARIISFRQEPPSGLVRARCYERMCKTDACAKFALVRVWTNSSALSTPGARSAKSPESARGMALLMPISWTGGLPSVFRTDEPYRHSAGIWNWPFRAG